MGRRVHESFAAASHEVIALTRPGRMRETAATPRGTIAVEHDLEDETGLAKIFADYRPDAVVHLAWFTAHGAYWSAPENLDCVRQSLGLLRAAATAGCRRFVGAGTCAEYDWAYERLIEGTTPCVPQTLYGAAKLAGYLIGERYAAVAGLSFAWARYGFLFGPGEPTSRLTTAAATALLSGHDFPCSPGDQLRDFIYVEDAADATVALAQSDVTGAVNVGSGTPVPVRQLIEEIAALAAGPGRPLFGALPARPGDPHLLALDTTRLTVEVGWRPRWSLREGLGRVVDACSPRGVR